MRNINKMNSIIESFSNFGCLGASKQSHEDASQVDAAGYDVNPSFHIRNRAKKQLTESNPNHQTNSKPPNNLSFKEDKVPSTTSPEVRILKFQEYLLESQKRELVHRKRRKEIFRPQDPEDAIHSSVTYSIPCIMRSVVLPGGLCALRTVKEEPKLDAASLILLNLTHHFDNDDDTETSVQNLDPRNSVVESSLFHSRLNYNLFEEDEVDMEDSNGVKNKFRQIRKHNKMKLKLIAKMQCRTDLFPHTEKYDQKLPNDSPLNSGVDKKQPASDFIGKIKSTSPTSVNNFDDGI